MAVEIERKFIVTGDGWRERVVRSEQLKQGYLTSASGVTVRIRTFDDSRAYLTIKAGGSALARAEYEYEIPITDARALLRYCAGSLIGKRRSTLDLKPGDWIVDEFEGRHQGLVLAEIELATPSVTIEIPAWLGREVTADPQYYNSSLAALPSGGEI